MLLEDDVRVERGVTRWPRRVSTEGSPGLEVDAPLSKELLAEMRGATGEGAEL